MSEQTIPPSQTETPKTIDRKLLADIQRLLIASLEVLTKDHGTQYDAPIAGSTKTWAQSMRVTSDIELSAKPALLPNIREQLDAVGMQATYLVKSPKSSLLDNKYNVLIDPYQADFADKFIKLLEKAENHQKKQNEEAPEWHTKIAIPEGFAERLNSGLSQTAHEIGR